jgi:ABC-2 type transport system permease protein
MVGIKILILVVVIVLARFLILKGKRSANKSSSSSSKKQKKPLSGWQKQLFTVAVFTKLSTKRFFRDRLALFFGILFPLIFLFVFGSLSSGGGKLSFSVALLNQSSTSYSRSFVKQIESQSVYKVDTSVTNLSEAEDKMDKSQLDGVILLPKNFGFVSPGQKYPTGQVQVLYTENDQASGDTLASVLQANLKSVNAKFVPVSEPFSVQEKQLNQKSLTTFDYTFSGLLGFSIIGIGIFGPINVFPELKKQGILRRLHTTPIKVWQYFMSTMFSQAITGVVSIAIQFIVAITVFHLKVDGNYFEILAFTLLSIFMILGIGLAIGGWAKNERQAAPLSNIIVFPMLFLSGTFFPRFEMPHWLQIATNYLPLTPVIDGLRILTTEGKNLTQIGPQLGLVAIWMIIVYAIAFRVFKWE